MSDAAETSGGGADALRLQIESGLRAAERERRRRLWLGAGGALLGLALLLNLLVLIAPGSVGLARSSEVDGLRDDVLREVSAATAAQQAQAQETLDAARAAARDAARPDAASAAVPGICATLAELGDWSFVGGSAPQRECPTGP
jgi:hypothetical protein